MLPTRHEQDLVRMPHCAPPKLISELIATLWASTETYGKPFDGAALQGWYMVVALEEITTDELTHGVRHFIRQEKFPMPGRFAAWVRDQREIRLEAERMADMKRRIQQEDADRLAEIEKKYEGWTADQLRDHIRELMATNVTTNRERRKRLDLSVDYSDPKQEARWKAALEKGKESTEDEARP